DALRSTLGNLREYDAIVSSGWVMATIGQRLLMDWPAENGRVRHVRLHGYRDQISHGDVLQDSKVLLLLDVVATGSQMMRLATPLAIAGSVTTRALVIAEPYSGQLPADFGALWSAPMAVATKTLPQCAEMETREYN